MSKADVLLKKAASFEKLALYSDRKTFLRALAQDRFTPEEVKQYNNLDEFGNPVRNGIPPVEPEDPGAHEPAMIMPADKISVFPQINPKEQEALSRIVTIEGLGIPLTIDGKLGPKTRKALQLFKSKFNFNHLTDQQALTAASLKAQDAKYSPNYKSFFAQQKQNRT